MTRFLPRSFRLLLLCGVLGGMMAGGGCCRTMKSANAVAEPAAKANQTEQTFRQNLPELAKGHQDKIDLAWYAQSPLMGYIDPDVAEFTKQMSTEHKALQKRLEAWAKAHKYDLKFQYGDDAVGQARAAIEKDDGKIIRGLNHTDFQRLLLVLMFADYDWQKHLVQALIPLAQGDPELKGYLEQSYQVHTEHLAKIQTLLARYQYK